MSFIEEKALSKKEGGGGTTSKSRTYCGEWSKHKKPRLKDKTTNIDAKRGHMKRYKNDGKKQRLEIHVNS